VPAEQFSGCEYPRHAGRPLGLRHRISQISASGTQLMAGLLSARQTGFVTQSVGAVWRRRWPTEGRYDRMSTKPPQGGWSKRCGAGGEPARRWRGPGMAYRTGLIPKSWKQRPVGIWATFENSAAAVCSFTIYQAKPGNSPEPARNSRSRSSRGANASVPCNE